MSNSKVRPSSIPESIEAFTDKQLPTCEELECQRRGYKLLRVTLGKGAYAKVKLACVSPMKLEKHRYLKEELKKQGSCKVAIKIISKKTAPVEYMNKFMPREIEALTTINNCPNVVKLFETFHSESRIYLVLEYADKGDLLEFINSRRPFEPGIGEEKAKKFFKQLVRGLDHCHKRNIVHRDMKCENILIQGDDIIKISDFGFATRFPTSRQPLLETFCGSYAYAAPEILQAEKYDGKIADIWSLGIILFAMLNGRLPFNDRDITTLIEQTKGKLRFASKVQVSSECQDLVKRILTANHRKRITIAEILLHPWLQTEKLDDDLMLSLTRGVPDGKSEKSVIKSIEEMEEVNKFNDAKTSKVAKDVILGNKVELCTQGGVMEKWVEKNCKGSKMAKLLREQLEENMRNERLTNALASNSKKEENYNETQLCDISNLAWCSMSQKSPANLKSSAKPEDKKKEDKCRNVKTEAHEYRYQKEAAKRGQSDDRKCSSSKDEDDEVRASTTNGKWTEVKIPVSNLKTNGKSKIYYPGLSKKKDSVQGLNLPPVGNENGGNMSAGQSKFPTHFEQKEKKTNSKQYKDSSFERKAANLLNIRVNLRGNWPKKSSKITMKKKNALKYYTLSGKEVKHSFEHDDGTCTVVKLDVHGRKAPL